MKKNIVIIVLGILTALACGANVYQFDAHRKYKEYAEKLSKANQKSSKEIFKLAKDSQEGWADCQERLKKCQEGK